MTLKPMVIRPFLLDFICDMSGRLLHSVFWRSWVTFRYHEVAFGYKAELTDLIEPLEM